MHSPKRPKCSKTCANSCDQHGASNPENVTIIYRQVIEPIITYGAEVWGDAVKYQCVIRRLRTFQRTFAIRAIRGFHTVSAVSASALSQFMPLHLKIKEIQSIETVKRTGVCPTIPEDITLERRAKPEEKLHPSKRRFIQIRKRQHRKKWIDWRLVPQFTQMVAN